MNHHLRLWGHPAILDAARLLGAAAAGSVLLCYGLVHLLVWPGAPTGTPGERYRWDGSTGVLDWLPHPAVSAVGGLLLAVSVLGYACGAAGVIGMPVMRQVRLGAIGVGASSSLCLYAVTWPGLQPTPTDFSAGPVISALLLACVLATAWARRHPPRTSAAGGDGAGQDGPGWDGPSQDPTGRDDERNRPGRRTATTVRTVRPARGRD
ncbi:hypothetical protein [Frankia sp. AgKG'84/4]|uniref:hypothetical protein n=1 Tax=Frankia sp. AgKG'84/4 TaxID=573490 RepID=UPI00200BEF79|nr:hypothetical protein [Frankia sp. AgKG'84/4]MCL9793753.1 hypothetical protein [Frankia sp. AgKG'84/4]